MSTQPERLTYWQFAERHMIFASEAQKEEIRKALLAEQAQLWHKGMSCAVTEVTTENTLHILQASGSLADLIDLLDSALIFAKVAGCVGIELSGRRGWWRVMSKFGFIPDGDRMFRAV